MKEPRSCPFLSISNVNVKAAGYRGRLGCSRCAGRPKLEGGSVLASGCVPFPPVWALVSQLARWRWSRMGQGNLHIPHGSIVDDHPRVHLYLLFPKADLSEKGLLPFFLPL